MKQLLNTLFILSEDIYLTLDGENVVAKREGKEVQRYALHTLSGIITFSYLGASPALMGKCAEMDILLSFCKPNGRFLARICGETTGNVLLRRTQYRIADSPEQSCLIARNFIIGKVYNARWSIERTLRDHRLRIDEERMRVASMQLKRALSGIAKETEMDSLARVRRCSCCDLFRCTG